jgi:hypothetical protein
MGARRSERQWLAAASNTLLNPAGYSRWSMIQLRLPNLEENDHVQFVTIIPLSFWAIILLLLFMWAAFGLNGMVLTVVGLALITFFGQLGQNRR